VIFDAMENTFPLCHHIQGGLRPLFKEIKWKEHEADNTHQHKVFRDYKTTSASSNLQDFFCLIDRPNK
jgi:hypothetical protein